MIHVQGLPELIKALNNMGVCLDDEIKPILNEQAESIAESMRGNIHERTGRLANSIKNLNPTKFKYAILVGPDYTPDGGGTMTIPALAKITEYGRGPVHASKAEFLTFKSQTGEWVRKRETAALPARSFIRTTYTQVQNTVSEKVVNALSKVIQKKAKENNLTI